MLKTAVSTLILLWLCSLSISCIEDLGTAPPPPPSPPEFVYPLTTGNSWVYLYHYHHHFNNLSAWYGSQDISGSQLWSVKSATITGGASTYLIAVTRQDTVTQDSVSINDTTHIHTVSFRTDTLTFPIVVSDDSIHAGWTTLMQGIPYSTLEELEHIPRFPTPFTDTLQIHQAVYINHVGLTEYNLRYGTYTQWWEESLHLVSESLAQ